MVTAERQGGLELKKGEKAPPTRSVRLGCGSAAKEGIKGEMIRSAYWGGRRSRARTVNAKSEEDNIVAMHSEKTRGGKSHDRPYKRTPHRRS